MTPLSSARVIRRAYPATEEVIKALRDTESDQKRKVQALRDTVQNMAKRF